MIKTGSSTSFGFPDIDKYCKLDKFKKVLGRVFNWLSLRWKSRSLFRLPIDSGGLINLFSIKESDDI